MRKRLPALFLGLMITLWGFLWLGETLWEPAWKHAQAWVCAPKASNPRGIGGVHSFPDPKPHSKSKDPGLLFLGLPPIPHHASLLRELVAQGLQRLDEQGSKPDAQRPPLPIRVLSLPNLRGIYELSSKGQPAVFPKLLQGNRVLILCLSFRSVDPYPPLGPPIRATLWSSLRSWIPLLRVDREQALPEVHRPGFFPKSLRLFFRHGIAEEAKLWARFERVLTQFRELAKKAGSKLVPLYLPQAFEADGAVLTRLLAGLHLDPKEFESGRPSRRFRDLCQHMGLPYVATVTALRRPPDKTKRPLFIPLDEDSTAHALLTKRGLRLLLRPLLPKLRAALRSP